MFGNLSETDQVPCGEVRRRPDGPCRNRPRRVRGPPERSHGGGRLRRGDRLRPACARPRSHGDTGGGAGRPHDRPEATARHPRDRAPGARDRSAAAAELRDQALAGACFESPVWAGADDAALETRPSPTASRPAHCPHRGPPSPRSPRRRKTAPDPGHVGGPAPRSGPPGDAPARHPTVAARAPRPSRRRARAGMPPCRTDRCPRLSPHTGRTEGPGRRSRSLREHGGRCRAWTRPDA